MARNGLKEESMIRNNLEEASKLAGAVLERLAGCPKMILRRLNSIVAANAPQNQARNSLGEQRWFCGGLRIQTVDEM